MIIVVTEFWYDTGPGKLIVGYDAYLARLTQGCIDLTPLPDLVRDPNFPYLNGDFERLDTAEWTRQDYINFGHWALSIVQNPEETVNPVSALTRDHLDRFRILGLGPGAYALRREFGPLWRFREALDMHAGKANRRYADWSLQDFSNYTARIAREIRRKPTEADFADFHRRGLGPHFSEIQQRVRGGIRRLNDSVGYPDITDWQPEDYIYWGVNVMKANEDQQLTEPMLYTLSRKKRGPSARTIANHFGNLTPFYWQVEEAHAASKQAEEKRTAEKLTEIFALTESDVLPTDVLQLEPNRQLAILGQWSVARHCLPHLPPERLSGLATVRGSRFITELKKAGRSVRTVDIELAALQLGYSDDLWPLDGWLRTLKVSKAELERARRRTGKR